jgi:hypothetical protein
MSAALYTGTYALKGQVGTLNSFSIICYLYGNGQFGDSAIIILAGRIIPNKSKCRLELLLIGMKMFCTNSLTRTVPSSQANRED